jgi:hypothetical protein
MLQDQFGFRLGNLFFAFGNQRHALFLLMGIDYYRPTIARSGVPVNMPEIVRF